MQFTMLVGRLTKDPQRIECNDKILCKFGMATNGNYTKDGERVAEFHTVIVWGIKAENCLKYLKKGSLVAVLGEIQTRKWDNNGETKYSTEIVCKEIEILTWLKDDKNN